MVTKQDNNPQNEKITIGATPRKAGRSPNTNKRTALQALVDSLVNQDAVASEENPLSQGFDVVALTASADGLNALSCVLSALPANFPAAIVIVQHLSPRHPSLMAQILNRCTPLVVKEAKEGSQLSPGKVFIAPPDHHLIVNPNGSLSLSQTEKVHFVRPAAEILFESVAQSYKQRSLAVVLTGGDGDGSRGGVQAIKKMGGKVIAQDEATSKVWGMPSSAIATGCVDWILPLDKIAGVITNLVMHGEIQSR